MWIDKTLSSLKHTTETTSLRTKQTTTQQNLVQLQNMLGKLRGSYPELVQEIKINTIWKASSLRKNILSVFMVFIVVFTFFIH
jgi:hypothetical protein